MTLDVPPVDEKPAPPKPTEISNPKDDIIDEDNLHLDELDFEVLHQIPKTLR
jgi:hypothetical protein